MNLRTVTLFGAQPGITTAEFDRLFLEHYRSIVSVAFRLVGDPDEAEELASDAFWKLWNEPPSSRENVPGWLYRVVTNLGYNRIRSRRRRTQYEGRSQAQDWPFLTAEKPEVTVERREERDSVRNVLRQMPCRDVQILILRSSGLSYKEIAESLSIASSSIGTLIARAEQKFDALYSRGEKKNAPE